MERCDHTSVGVIIRNPADEILLLNRARFPWGYAPPAGHIDAHGSPAQAAIQEVYEEVGLVLPVTGLQRVISERSLANRCRRPGGDYHRWTVYTAHTTAVDLTPSSTETRGARWWSPEAVTTLATDPVGERERLENIWLDFFQELGIIDLSQD